MTNLGPRIVAMRSEKGWSMSKLADESGISKSLLHRIENEDTSNPELGTLKKIAKALEVTVGDLLGNEVVRSVRQLPQKRPAWLADLVTTLKKSDKEPDEDLLEALYVLQNRKGQSKTTTEDWLYLYQTLERSFQR
jgi:transcriptional regulator with XRE-family HTH domain